jgi:hypothetical protein
MKKWLVLLLPLLAVTSLLPMNPEDRSEQATSRPPQAHHFDRSVAAILRVHLKPATKYWHFDHMSLDHAKAEEQLRQWKDQGIDAIEIFAPAEGGNSYGELDANRPLSPGSRHWQHGRLPLDGPSSP